MHGIDVCKMCNEPYDDDPDQVDERDESHLPVQSSRCQHILCYNCVFRYRLSKAEKASDRQFPSTKWLQCPWCRAKTSFNAQRPIVSYVVCELLRDRREKTTPSDAAASDDSSSSSSSSGNSNTTGGSEVDSGEEASSSEEKATQGDAKAAKLVIVAQAAEEVARKKSLTDQGGKKKKSVQHVPGQKSLMSYFGGRSAKASSPSSTSDVVSASGADSPVVPAAASASSLVIPPPSMSSKRSRSQRKVDDDDQDSPMSSPRVGDVGYEFVKFFEGHGHYRGKVTEVLPNGERRCHYEEDDDWEDMYPPINTMADDGENGAAVAAAAAAAEADVGDNVPGGPVPETPSPPKKRAYKKGTDSGGRHSDLSRKKSRRISNQAPSDNVEITERLLDIKDKTPEGKLGPRELNNITRLGGLGGQWRNSKSEESMSWRFHKVMAPAYNYQGSDGRERLAANEAAMLMIEEFDPTNPAAVAGAEDEEDDIDGEERSKDDCDDGDDIHLGKAIVSLDDMKSCMSHLSCDTCLQSRDRTQLEAFQKYMQKNQGGDAGKFFAEYVAPRPPTFNVVPKHMGIATTIGFKMAEMRGYPSHNERRASVGTEDDGDGPMILQPPPAVASAATKDGKTSVRIPTTDKPSIEKPKNAKVWNKSLVMMIKEKKLRPQKDGITNFFRSANDTIWKNAQRAIKAEGADDIFVSANGRIMGLPKNLDKRVRRFCKQVITGDPEIYLSKEQNRYLKDNGSRSIDIGGEVPKRDSSGKTVMTPQLSGPFALLMAFHENDDGVGIFTTSELQKKQEDICGREVAQKIEGLKGYLCGVWTRSINTLEGHHLVERTERGEKTKLERDGYQDTFELTKDGDIFIKALVRCRGEDVRKYYRRDIQKEYFGGVEKMKHVDLKLVAQKRRRLN